MSERQLLEIRNRATAATAPSHVVGFRVWCASEELGDPGRVLLTVNPNYPTDADIEFLLHARADVLRLLEMIAGTPRAEETAAPPHHPTVATTYHAIVGATLASVRIRSGATLADVSRAVDVKTSAWRAIERGSSAVSVEFLARFAEYAGASPGDLLSRADRVRRILELRGVFVSPKRLTAPQMAADGLCAIDAASLVVAVTLAEASP